MGIIEFHQEKQGRPAPPSSRSLETGQTTLYSSYTTLLEEYMGLKEVTDRLLNVQIVQLEKLLLEMKQIKFHVASLSEENIQPEDMEE